MFAKVTVGKKLHLDVSVLSTVIIGGAVIRKRWERYGYVEGPGQRIEEKREE